MDDIEDIRTQGMRLFDESQPIHAPQTDIDNSHAYFAQGSQRLFTAAHGQDGKTAVFEVGRQAVADIGLIVQNQNFSFVYAVTSSRFSSVLFIGNNSIYRSS